MIRPPPHVSAFEFVILAGLRAVQLSRGCTPRVLGDHKRIVIAQLEVASGAVTRLVDSVDVARQPI